LGKIIIRSILRSFKVDIDAYPNIKRINATLIEMDPFKKADAFCQIDCPPDLVKK